MLLNLHLWPLVLPALVPDLGLPIGQLRIVLESHVGVVSSQRFDRCQVELL